MPFLFNGEMARGSSLALNIQMGTIKELEWAATVRFLLSTLGMDTHLRNPGLVTTEKFANICFFKLSNLCIMQWHRQMTGVSLCQGETNKLRFYKLFKTSFEMEPYLNLIPNFQLRKCISKFRCSDYSLEIEVRRHKKLQVEEHICKI